MAQKAKSDANKKPGRAAHLKKHQFKPGTVPNPKGRPKGSRNKLGEAFLEALHADFEEHGAATIARCRTEDPVAYVKVCASILPKDLNVNVNPVKELTDAELVERINSLAAAVQGSIGATGGTVGGTATPDSDQPTGGVSPVH